MKKNSPAIFLLLQFLVFVPFTFAQEKSGPTWASFEQAKQVVDAGITAIGGMESIRRADKITINYNAVNYPVGQNAAFNAPPAEFIRIGARTMIDYSGGRYVTDGQSNSAGGYKFNFRQVINPKRSFSIDVNQNRRGNTIVNLSPIAQAGVKFSLLLEAPHLLLLYISERPETLRYGGEAVFQGRKYQVVNFSAETGTQISLYFDRQTKLPARYEQITNPSMLLGDVVSSSEYSDYRTINGVQVPGKRIGTHNGVVIVKNEYAEVKFDFAEGEKLLEVPKGYVDAPAAPANAEVMRKIGDGVYLVERVGQNYRVAFVEFEDYVMVLETPTDANASKAIINLIKQTVSNKPVKYVSFSHFHLDHTSGLREYISQGATIIVPPGNRSFVETAAKSKFTIKPDALSLNPRSPIIETFDKKRVFTDGKQIVEFYNIGPTSHVNDMVMFYFPKEKILFQGDMFSPLDAGGIPPIIEINHELAKKVEELKLDVETLIAVHSGVVAWKDFLTAVKKSFPK